MSLHRGNRFSFASIVSLLLVLLLRHPVVVGGKKFLYEDSKDVIEVKQDEGYFQTSVKTRIVEFYSPYCVSRSIVARSNLTIIACVLCATVPLCELSEKVCTGRG